MSAYLAEFIGTALIIVFGNGVVCNVVLSGSKGRDSGWIVICFGWSMAVFIGVFASAAASGAHLNPAVSIAFAVLGDMEVSRCLAYILAQFAGAAFGQLVVWLVYRLQFDATESGADKLACFSNAPAIRHLPSNLLTEALATFVFVLAILSMAKPSTGLGALDALPVAFLVLGVGLSLGGPTGYAINPARDLSPRIVHALLPMRGKSDSDWAYAWVPVLGPILGALLAALVFPVLKTL
jgi:glycerol uptake facilitator protein